MSSTSVGPWAVHRKHNRITLSVKSSQRSASGQAPRPYTVPSWSPTTSRSSNLSGICGSRAGTNPALSTPAEIWPGGVRILRPDRCRARANGDGVVMAPRPESRAARRSRPQPPNRCRRERSLDSLNLQFQPGQPRFVTRAMSRGRPAITLWMIRSSGETKHTSVSPIFTRRTRCRACCS